MKLRKKMLLIGSLGVASIASLSMISCGKSHPSVEETSTKTIAKDFDLKENIEDKSIERAKIAIERSREVCTAMQSEIDSINRKYYENYDSHQGYDGPIGGPLKYILTNNQDKIVELVKGRIKPLLDIILSSDDILLKYKNNNGNGVSYSSVDEFQNILYSIKQFTIQESIKYISTHYQDEYSELQNVIRRYTEEIENKIMFSYQVVMDQVMIVYSLSSNLIEIAKENPASTYVLWFINKNMDEAISNSIKATQIADQVKDTQSPILKWFSRGQISVNQIFESVKNYVDQQIQNMIH